MNFRLLINTIKSTHLWLVFVGFHDFQIFSDRTSRAWSVEVGKHVQAQSLLSKSAVKSIPTSVPCQAKKDSNIPSPGRTRLVKCPTPGPTKTIKPKPHALPPPSPPPPPAGFTLIGAYLFYFVFEGNFPCTSPWAAYIWRGDLTEGFLHYWFEGLILGGVYMYFRTFTVSICIFVHTWKDKRLVKSL